MAGKRERKGRSWAPGILMTLMAASMLVLLGGPHSVAVNSPVEKDAAEPLPVEAAFVPMPGAADEPAGPVAVEKPEEKAWEGPVPAGEPVEDTYFEDVVFLGDSRTDGFRLYSGLEQGTYFCVTGATVESVFTKKAWEMESGEKFPLLDALAEAACGKVYLMLGINELGWAGTEIFRSQSTKLIDRLREDHPEAEIVIQSILPVSAEQEAKNSYVNNKRIEEYNEIWKQLAKELDVAYVNVAEVLTGEDGCLPQELTFDGVHLNSSGCKIWLDYLRTHAIVEEAA